MPALRWRFSASCWSSSSSPPACDRQIGCDFTACGQGVLQTTNPCHGTVCRYSSRGSVRQAQSVHTVCSVAALHWASIDTDGCTRAITPYPSAGIDNVVCSIACCVVMCPHSWILSIPRWFGDCVCDSRNESSLWPIPLPSSGHVWLFFFQRCLLPSRQDGCGLIGSLGAQCPCPRPIICFWHLFHGCCFIASHKF